MLIQSTVAHKEVTCKMWMCEYANVVSNNVTVSFCLGLVFGLVLVLSFRVSISSNGSITQGIGV